LPPRHQTFPAAEHQYQRYQIILLDDNRGTCANKLPTVVTREWNGRESNLPPLELHVQLPDHCTIRPRKVSAGPTFQNVRQHTWQTEMVHEPYGVKRISGMDAIIINVFSKTLGHRNSRKKNHTRRTTDHSLQTPRNTISCARYYDTTTQQSESRHRFAWNKSSILCASCRKRARGSREFCRLMPKGPTIEAR